MYREYDYEAMAARARAPGASSDAPLFDGPSGAVVTASIVVGSVVMIAGGPLGLVLGLAGAATTWAGGGVALDWWEARSKKGKEQKAMAQAVVAEWVKRPSPLSELPEPVPAPQPAAAPKPSMTVTSVRVDLTQSVEVDYDRFVEPGKVVPTAATPFPLAEIGDARWLRDYEGKQALLVEAEDGSTVIVPMKDWQVRTFLEDGEAIEKERVRGPLQ